MSEAEMLVCDIEATMKYVVRGEKATFHAGDRSKSYWPAEEHRVTIHDMRPEAEELAFDRNGFVLLDEPSAVKDFADDAAIAAYSRETEALIQRLTGAAKTVSFGPVIRTNAAGAQGHNQPAYGAHVDYGDRTVRDYTYDLLPQDEAARRLEGRYMLINVWRPIAMVESAPLALCDASTVKRKDMFDSEVIGGLGSFGTRSLWGFNLAWAPGQRWYWVPHMQPWEVLAFKLYDSDPDAVQFTAHSAFEDPNTPVNAAPRQSIELRTISYMN
ncbi:MAG: CmcJ/NvfI family oxidoreductase [Candidatus Andeanibacterium colombiense]|uniref:CmcJ/NvfI family oxidoreductase n=1 Tax=Candidatus Andeanibacterium colombiense TaxID=3121345 RepID=A0AAJ6BMZ2_9SPHN|nr:MAG: CmcJ/NvfI family oxidoreductase [Sphingomonadaceae bacterium]